MRESVERGDGKRRQGCKAMDKTNEGNEDME